MEINTLKKIALSNKELISIIRENGLEATDIRVEILKVMMNEDIDFNVNDVHCELPSCDIIACLATVYNTFNAFESANIIIEVPSIGNSRSFKLNERIL